MRLVAIPAERDKPTRIVPDARKREPGRGVSVHARLQMSGRVVA
jgi:hypothetical protein